MDGLSSEFFNGLGLSGFFGVGIFALFRGWVIVKPVYDAIVAERNYWRDAFFKEQAAHAETTTQNGQLLSSSGELQSKLVQVALDMARHDHRHTEDTT
jgi:hypothetical protein